MRVSASLIPLAVLGALSACATVDDSVDVTRFHLDQPAARGQVYLEPVVSTRAGTLEFQTYSAIVADAMRTSGFSVTDNRDRAELVGSVDYAQDTRENIAARSPVSVGIGGGTGGRSGGIGLGTSFGLGGGASEVVTTLLELRLTRTSDDTTIWEGRATQDAKAGTPEADLRTALPVLATRLLRDYPGQSGETVTYRD